VALAPLLGELVFKPWVFGIPGVVACWAFLGIVMWVILHRTVYGKQRKRDVTAAAAMRR
jgi:ribose transport system permease protein